MPQVIISEMREIIDSYTYSPLRKTLKRCKSEVKLQSNMLDDYSITKTSASKTIVKCTSDCSLRNTLFTISLFYSHFIMGEK